ncbi:hypothetical protein [Trichloromonas sp.]|uniref:hypothetical protein n=1 Tax=Trichloromonas sp. TaxID=3069249 RepID=UPI002A46E6F4|nr:hypothetical protein [Trichloromonas sp.]
MNKKLKVGLDLTKPKIKKFNEFNELIIQESINNTDVNLIKKSFQNIGIDIVNDKSGYKIDITKYGEDIE